MNQRKPLWLQGIAYFLLVPGIDSSAGWLLLVICRNCIQLSGTAVVRGPANDHSVWHCSWLSELTCGSSWTEHCTWLLSVLYGSLGVSWIAGGSIPRCEASYDLGLRLCFAASAIIWANCVPQDQPRFKRRGLHRDLKLVGMVCACMHACMCVCVYVYLGTSYCR